MSDLSLMKKLVKGKTHNRNESFHGVVWSRCSKIRFVSLLHQRTWRSYGSSVAHADHATAASGTRSLGKRALCKRHGGTAYHRGIKRQILCHWRHQLFLVRGSRFYYCEPHTAAYQRRRGFCTWRQGFCRGFISNIMWYIQDYYNDFSLEIEVLALLYCKHTKLECAWR